MGEDVTHLIRFRYDNESRKFKTTWKILNGDKVLNFAGPWIDEDDGHKFILFPATEVPQA
jgi:hypothetical protein